MFDLILEPIAIKLDYWTWAERYSNTKLFAWFLLHLFLLYFWLFKIKVTSKISLHYLLVQFVFFVYY
jgi:putative membrane protein